MFIVILNSLEVTMSRAQWIPVDSSNVMAIAYSTPERRLLVRFKGTADLMHYEYAEVPRELFEQFEQAESKGKFFNQFIKNAFEFTKVTISGKSEA